MLLKIDFMVTCQFSNWGKLATLSQIWSKSDTHQFFEPLCLSSGDIYFLASFQINSNASAEPWLYFFNPFHVYDLLAASPKERSGIKARLHIIQRSWNHRLKPLEIYFGIIAVYLKQLNILKLYKPAPVSILYKHLVYWL